MVIYERDNLGITIVDLIFKNRGSIYLKDGVSNFLAHMLNTKGDSKLKERFYSELENKAVKFNVKTNYEYFSIELTFLNEKSKFALNKLKEILLSPNFTLQAFDVSKKEILAKKESLKNNNDYIAKTNLFKVMFKDTPLFYPVIGENIENIALEDIKKGFETLSKNGLVVLNGGKKIDENFEYLNKKDVLKDKFFTTKVGEMVEYKNVEQSFIHFGSEFNVKKEELYLAKISTFILGAGGFGSRIMEEIRVKRGYAYSAYAMNEFKKSYKILRGFLQTKLDNTDDAINLVKDIILKFTNSGVTEKELNEAKKFLVGSEPLRNETLYQRLLRKFNEEYFELGEGYYKKELELIEKVSLDEVNDFIKRHNEINNLSFSIVTNDNKK